MNPSVIHLVILYSFIVVLCAICIYLLYMVITLQSQWNIFQDFFRSQMFTDEFYAVLDTYFVNHAQRSEATKGTPAVKTSTSSSFTPTTTTTKQNDKIQTEKTIFLQVDTSVPIQVQSLDLQAKVKDPNHNSTANNQKNQSSCTVE